jgi:hypothetical protein
MRSTISVLCPDCKDKMMRISYWDNARNGIHLCDNWFICKKCNMTHQISYSFKPRKQKGKGVKNAKSI